MRDAHTSNRSRFGVFSTPIGGYFDCKYPLHFTANRPIIDLFAYKRTIYNQPKNLLETNGLVSNYFGTDPQADVVRNGWDWGFFRMSVAITNKIPIMSNETTPGSVFERAIEWRATKCQ